MWEAACLGVPSVSVVVAANQAAPAAAATDLGFTYTVDARRAASPEIVEHATRELLADAIRRARMAQLGPSSVDGLGASRVAKFLSAAALDGRRESC